MSRTKPENNMSNPAKVKLEWVGHEEGGFFKAWDGEKDIKVGLPIRCAYLDNRKAVGGFYEKVERGFYSNEVKYTNREEFDVRYSKGGSQHPVAKGMWNDIKGTIGPMGAKFCNVVYATLLESDSEIPSGTLVKIPMLGAAGKEWIDLKIADGESFEVSAYEDRKKGRTEYRAPLIRKIEITDAEGEIADSHDELLQAFFDSKKAPANTRAPEECEDAPPAVSDDDGGVIPF